MNIKNNSRLRRAKKVRAKIKVQGSPNNLQNHFVFFVEKLDFQ